MPRSTEDLVVALAEDPSNLKLKREYAEAMRSGEAAWSEPPHPADEPLDEPEQLHGGRILIPGVVDGSVSAIETLLRDHRKLLLGSEAPLRLNDLSGAIEQCWPGKPSERAWDVGDLVTRLRIAVERKICFETKRLDQQGRCIRAKLRIEKENAKDVVLHMAKEQRFSPVREWLEQLPRAEPGVISIAAREALGLEREIDFKMWRMWLIGCVARAMEPGCQLDTVLVLVAPGGGERKSSMFRSLVTSKWFSDTHLDMVGFKRQDSYMQLHRVWIYEVPELEGAKDSEQRSRTKSFVSSRSDDFRAPYDDVVRAHPRSVALGATTNSESFLTGGADPAFDRRFFPLRITGQIDTEMIEKLRDQIWSEAFSAYESGETFHFSKTDHDALIALRERQSEVTEQDPWHGPIKAYIEAPVRQDKALRLLDVMRVAIGLQKKECGMSEQKRVGAVLGTLGYTQMRRRWMAGCEKEVRWCSTSQNGQPSEGARAPFDEPEGARHNV